MPDKELSLGTVFTGRVDAAFTNATDKLLKITKDLTKNMGNLQRAIQGVGNAAGDYSTKMDKAAKKSELFGTRAQFIGKQLSRVGNVFQDTVRNAFRVTAAYGIAAGAIYKVTAGFRAGVSEIINYDQALKNLQAITRATDQEVLAMGERIKDVATTTKFSSTEVAEGMVLLGQAGLSAAESMQAIQATSDLATGTLSNMQLTSDLMTTTLRAFNLEAVESNRVADVMANAINRSKLTIDKLRIAFNFVGAAAAQTGLSIEETAASMMVLANNGLRASTIGTGLRQVMARLLAPNRKLRDAFEMNGIKLDEVNPRLVGFQTSLARLAPILYDSEKGVVDMGKAYELFGLRGAQAAAVLMKAFLSGSYNSMLKKVYEFGTASEMAAKQAEGLGVMFKNLADRAKVMFLALGDTGLTGILRNLTVVLRSLVDSVTALLKDPFGRFAVQSTVLSSALMALTAVLAAMIKIFKYIIPLFMYFGKAANWVAIALGVVLAAMNAVMDRTRSMTRELELSSEKYKENISVLENYSKTLETLKGVYDRNQKEGKDNTKVVLDYGNTLQHLIKLYPDLKDQIKFTTGAWEENQEAIRKFLDINLDKALGENSKLIKQYSKDIREQAFWWGLWAESIRVVKDVWNQFVTAIKEGAPTKIVGGVLKDIKDFVVDVSIHMFPFLKQWGKDFDEIGKGIKKSFEDFKEDMILAGQETDKFKATQEKLNATFLDRAKLLKQDKKSYIEIAHELREQGLSWDRIREIMHEIHESLIDIRGASKIDPNDKLLKNSQYYLKYLQMEAQYTENKEKAIRAAYNVEMQKIEEFEEKRREELSKKPDVTVTEAQLQAEREAGNLRVQLAKQLKQKLLELELETQEELLNLRISTEKRNLEIQKQNATGETARQINLKLKQLEVDHLNEIVELRKQFYEKFKGLLGAENPKVIELLQKLNDAQVNLAKSTTKELTAENKERERVEKNYIKYLLETSKRTGEEYAETLKRAYELDIINLEDYLDRKVAAVGSFKDNLVVGFDQARRELQTFGELTQDIGKQFPETFSNNLTGALWDFAEGTKSAKDAMEDFAKSTIRWLGEIITKWAIFNAVMGILPGGSKYNTKYGWGGYEQGFHKGGIVGVTSPTPVRITNPNIFANAMRLHSGLKSDEFPAILQKGETVIPKGGGVTVNVINKSGIPLDASQGTPRFAAGDMILDVVVDAAMRNKRGFRNNMKGLLR